MSTKLSENLCNVGTYSSLVCFWIHVVLYCGCTCAICGLTHLLSSYFRHGHFVASYMHVHYNVTFLTTTKSWSFTLIYYYTEGREEYERTGDQKRPEIQWTPGYSNLQGKYNRFQLSGDRIPANTNYHMYSYRKNL